jgi:hypothetical protein
MFIRWKNAVFCFEEVIVNVPQNYHAYNKYAELLYTMGVCPVAVQVD